MKDNDIIVGTIDDFGAIKFRKGGTHPMLHGSAHGKSDQDWRYNPLTERIYWHEKHSSKDEMLVKEWLDYKGFKVRQHITLSNIFDTTAYQDMWDEAHGIESKYF